MRHNIIILANSRKMRNRCIAGVDVQNGAWVRPCFETGEEGIPWSIRKIDNAEPQLLDIIAIPLANDGPHRDIQPENRSLSEGVWEKVDRTTIKQVLKYRQKSGTILHNTERRIHISKLQTVHERERKSLCMIQTNVVFTTEASFTGKKRVVAAFEHYGVKYRIPVTDYEFEHAFPPYNTREAECLLTVSLGMPYEMDNYCYKLVAGVIEL